MTNSKIYAKGSATTITLRDIDGACIFDTTGKKVGVIDDVVINRDTGQTAVAVIRVGGFLGLGSSRHEVSCSQLEHLHGSQGFEVPLDGAKLAWIHLSEDAA